MNLKPSQRTILLNLTLLSLTALILTAPCLATDQDILFGFYNSLEISGSLFWNTTGLICNQTGIICSSPGVVSDVRLPNKGLRGTLPESFAFLSGIRVLQFDANQLYGTLPSSYGNLTSLVALTMYGNELTGSLPSEWATLTSLTYIALYSNNLKGTLPPEWNVFPSLQILLLYSNRLTGTLPSRWATLRSLQYLWLDSNPITGTLPSEWHAMQSLVSLQVYSTSLTGTLPSEWLSLQSVGYLYLFANQLTGTLPTEWASLVNLQHLGLSHNSFRGTLPAQWSSMTNMKIFSADDNALEGSLPSEWSSMSSVTILTINLNNLSGTVPSTWADLSMLERFDISSNFLTGTIPPEWDRMQAHLNLLFLSSNYFDCDKSDFGSVSNLTDIVIWRVQCNYSCPEIVLPNVTFAETKSLNVQGVCETDNFRGNVSRQCLRTGIQRVWSDAGTGHCEAISPAEQLRSRWEWLLLPFGGFAVVLLLLIFYLRFQSSFVLMTAFVICHWFFSVVTLGSNIRFLSEFWRFGEVHSAVGVAILLLWLAANAAYCVILFRSCSGVTKAVNAVVAVLSVNDVTLFHMVDRQRECGLRIASFRLGNGFFQCFPMLILQWTSLSTVSPLITLISMALNVLNFVLLLCYESGHFQTATRSAPSSLKDPLLAASSANSMASPSLQSLLAPAPAPAPAPAAAAAAPVASLPFVPLFWLTFPLIVLSFLPQMVTIIGISYSVGSLKRLMWGYSEVTGRSSVILGGSRDLGLFAKRGVFLVSLSALSFAGVLLVILPWISVIGLTLVTYNKIQLQFTQRKSPWFGNYRKAIQAIFSAMTFCYFPFLDALPSVRYQKLSSVGRASNWKVVVAVAWFVVFEVALPVSDAVTDFLYSFQLRDISVDQHLENREVLQAWMVVSFLGSILGLIIGAARFFMLISPGFKSPSREKWISLFISHSIFGTSTSKGLNSFVKLCIVVGDDFLQLLVTTQTSGFVGPISPLWGFKVAIATVTVAFSLAELFSEFVFGKKVALWAKAVLQGVYFLLFVVAFSCALFVATKEDFCQLDRSVNNPKILSQIVTCESISGSLFMERGTAASTGTFLAATVNSSFNLIDNGGTIDISFARLTSVNSTFTFTGNSGAVSASFPALQTITSRGRFIVADNSGETVLTWPFLHDLDDGGVLTLKNNSDRGSLVFPGLTAVTGELSIESNQYELLDLPLLLVVKGSVVIADGQFSSLELLSLFSVTGALLLQNNHRLGSLDFPSLFEAPGNITIDNNDALVTCNFPQIVGTGFTVQISANPSLEKVSFPHLVNLNGIIFLDNNPRLKEIDVPRLFGMFGDSQLVISSNPSLLTLDLRGFHCNFIFSVVLFDNALLGAVYLQSRVCLRFIINIANPNILFVCPGC